MASQQLVEKPLVAVLAGVMVVACIPAEAARPRRGPSPEQIKKMKEEIEYRQKEVLRVQQEVAAKERELYLSFDENGNGKLGRKPGDTGWRRIPRAILHTPTLPQADTAPAFPRRPSPVRQRPSRAARPWRARAGRGPSRPRTPARARDP